MSDRDGSAQSTIGNFSMSVGLPHDVKGTHMSRLLKFLRIKKIL